MNDDARNDSVYEKERAQFAGLVELIDRLRGPKGCPWDREQTHESIKPHLLEEVYEFFEALEGGGDDRIAEELGDILLHVLFHARIGSETDRFDITGVMERLSAKLIDRHPHVFGEVDVEDAAEVIRNWEWIKANEPQHSGRDSLLEGVPKSLPALVRAWRVQKKASQYGFDWSDAAGPLRKLGEELKELKQAAESGDRGRIVAEMGDILFSLVNLSRFFEVQPEEALRLTTNRFIERFKYIESKVDRERLARREYSLEELDALWDEAKTRID
jgi:tetrapyrrole methylase family protein/MazG family protein